MSDIVNPCFIVAYYKYNLVKICVVHEGAIGDEIDDDPNNPVFGGRAPLVKYTGDRQNVGFSCMLTADENGVVKVSDNYEIFHLTDNSGNTRPMWQTLDLARKNPDQHKILFIKLKQHWIECRQNEADTIIPLWKKQ